MIDAGPTSRSVRMFLVMATLLACHEPFSPGQAAGYDVGPAGTSEGCTIGVAVSRATSDGRPLLWKIRDNSDLPDNSISFDTTFPHRFIAVTNVGDSEVWMGANEDGFAIINSTSLDLPSGSGGLNNGLLMRYALGICSTVEEFNHLLDSTNVAGRMTQGNFGVVDRVGAASIFEVGGSVYWRFDAHDSGCAPDGYILRTNFSMKGRGSVGVERYRRAVVQIGEFYHDVDLNFRKIIRSEARDFSDFASNPLPLPYPHQWTTAFPLGYIYSNVSICRHKSISAAAIIGVKAGEDPRLTTMWTILGQPASGIAVPYWPVGPPPGVAGGQEIPPLTAAANSIRSLLFDLPGDSDYLDSYKLKDECGNGLWSRTFPVEDSIFQAAEGLLEQWRRIFPSPPAMLDVEGTVATSALGCLTGAYDHLTKRVPFEVENNVPFLDENGKPLQRGNVLQVIRAGDDHTISPPDMSIGSPHRGQPTGDDHLIGIAHAVGENAASAGMFHFLMTGWTDRTAGSPAAGDLIYLRAFNSDDPATATHYGDANLFKVPAHSGLHYIPVLSRDRTSQPMESNDTTGWVPAQFTISQNFPNPFNSSTSIEYEVPADWDPHWTLDISVFNNLGQLVRALFSGVVSPGRQRVTWDGRDNGGRLQPTGVYYLRFRAGARVDVERMVLLK